MRFNRPSSSLLLRNLNSQLGSYDFKKIFLSGHILSWKSSPTVDLWRHWKSFSRSKNVGCAKTFQSFRFVAGKPFRFTQFFIVSVRRQKKKMFNRLRKQETLNRPRCVVGNFSPSQSLCFVVSPDKAVLSTMFFEMSDGLDLQHYENSKSLRPVISFVIDACECVDVVAHLSRDWSCAWSDNTFALIPRHKKLLNFWINDVHVMNAWCKHSWVMWKQSHAANHRIWIFCRIFCSRGG